MQSQVTNTLGGGKKEENYVIRRQKNSNIPYVTKLKTYPLENYVPTL
jgi:hypothetical protein